MDAFFVFVVVFSSFFGFVSSFRQSGSNSLLRFPSLYVLHFIMDHTQGREFHHHLARALMHLNYLAGLLPFFEPSIEWDDPPNELYPRTGRSHPAQRNLHTFVPLPASSTVPTMASHGGIPTHMILSPESNLRPLSISSRPRDEAGHSSIGLTVRNPTTESCPPSAPVPRLPVPDTPRVTSRTTTAVPIRSKQGANHHEDPQPKKKQRSVDTTHPSSIRPISLPIIEEVPLTASIQMIQIKKWPLESTQSILHQQSMLAL